MTCKSMQVSYSASNWIEFKIHERYETHVAKIEYDFLIMLMSYGCDIFGFASAGSRQQISSACTKILALICRIFPRRNTPP